MIRFTAVLSAAFIAALVAAPAVRAADLPQATRDMLKDLKIDEKLLAGSEKEYEVPAEWLAGAKKEGALKIIGTWDVGQHRKYMKPFEERYPGVKFDYTRAGRNDRTVKPLLAFRKAVTSPTSSRASATPISSIAMPRR